jgi:hypothetical protein
MKYPMTMQQNTRVAAQAQAPRDMDLGDNSLSAPSRSLAGRHILVLGAAGGTNRGHVSSRGTS